MALATALHKSCRKGALLFTFLAQKKRINYSLLRFGSNFAVKLSFQAAHFNTVRNLKFNYMGGSHGGVVKLTPRQNMRCGEKGVEIVTFRQDLLKKEVSSFTWLRRSSLRRKERSQVRADKTLPIGLVCIDSYVLMSMLTLEPMKLCPCGIWHW